MSYKIIDLSHPMGYMGPVWPHVVITGSPVISPDSSLLRAREHNMGLYKGATRRVSIFSGAMHIGTHCDSPLHEKENGWGAGEIPLEKCYGTGVVVDFRYMKKWHRITAEDFEKATPKIEEGDIVVCNTGWHHYWWKKAYVYHNHYPGLVPSGVEWLIKKKVKAVAGTWGALDHPLAYWPVQRDYKWRYDEYVAETGKDPAEDFPEYEPCHRLLCTNEIVAIENAGGDIDLVTGKRCTISAFFFRMERSQGHWTRLVAIVEE
jgi:kynurenine formamidase